MRLIGKCDCIEAEKSECGCKIPAVPFSVSLYPVEYKHGSVREEEEYQIQLCAQAMCLEEMFHTTINQGDIFFISSHRRATVGFSDGLRKKVLYASEMLHEIRDAFKVPRGEYGAKCKRCSIKEICMPKTKQSAQKYCAILESEARGEYGE